MDLPLPQLAICHAVKGYGGLYRAKAKIRKVPGKTRGQARLTDGKSGRERRTGGLVGEGAACVVVVDDTGGQTQAHGGVLPAPRLGGLRGCGAYQSSAGRATGDSRGAEEGSGGRAKHGGREGVREGEKRELRTGGRSRGGERHAPGKWTARKRRRSESKSEVEVRTSSCGLGALYFLPQA